VTAIRSTGSIQLVDVDQDEGGVKDRVLNQSGEPPLERKCVLGFAVGDSRALQWDRDREPDFGMKRR
jgi:hypothetical protein